MNENLNFINDIESDKDLGVACFYILSFMTQIRNQKQNNESKIMNLK